MQNSKQEQILNTIRRKTGLKQKVFSNTYNSFLMLKEVLKTMEIEYNRKLSEDFSDKIIAFRERSKFQYELHVAGDVLVFYMHSNVFEFDREHQIWKVSYVKENKMSTYSGVINIYNFLADSFKYDRTDDLGYLVGRFFINKDDKFFVEGKRQMGLLHANFGHKKIDKDEIRLIVETAIAYTLEFDLLLPPYEKVKLLTVEQINESRNRSKIRTGKRLGFGFRSDDVQGEELKYTGG